MPDIAVPTPNCITPPSFAAPLVSLRTLLRTATADDHARLDARLGTLDLGTAAGLRCFLEINAAALLPLEAALEAAGVADLLPDWHRHARSRSILADLAALGGTARPLEPPRIAGRFAMLGTLYVLEGSRLGAAHLLKAIRRSAATGLPTAFLGHGAGERLWPDFLAVLERHAGELPDEGSIVEPARRAFALFEQAAAPI